MDLRLWGLQLLRPMCIMALVSSEAFVLLPKMADAGLSQALDPMPRAASTCHERGGAPESLGRVVAVGDELLQHYAMLDWSTLSVC